VPHQKLVIPAVLKFQTTPCTWEVDSAGYFSCVKQTGPRGQPKDAWQVRADFLRLDDSRDDVLTFLNDTGVFCGGEGIHPENMRAVRQWRDLIRRLMLEEDFRNWDGILSNYPQGKIGGVRWESELSMRFDWNRKPPELLLSERTTLGAILATIHLDHVRHSTFVLCARSSCGAPFERTSNHGRVYCSRDCAKAESMQRARARGRTHVVSAEG